MKKIIFFAMALGLCSCSGFLDEYSQNNTYVETVEDLDDLLVGEGYISRSATAYTWLTIMSDELRELSMTNILAPNPAAGVYNDVIYLRSRALWGWDVQPFQNHVGVAQEDTNWAAFYKRIAAMNNILSEADQLEAGKEVERQALARVRGEALFIRAWNYFMLANIYGAPYDKSNLNDGASVSIKLTPAVDYNKFRRENTVAVYDQIVADLKAAVDWFRQGNAPASKRRASEAAAWAMLSRVYLYMEEYAAAVQAADNVKGFELLDLAADHTPGSGAAFLTLDSPEQIFAQGAFGLGRAVGVGEGVFGATMISYLDRGQTLYLARAESYGTANALQALFDNTDMRSSAFFTESCQFYANAASPKNVWMGRKAGSSADSNERDPISGTNPFNAAPAGGELFGEAVSIRYAEVVLNKAEALACAGQIAPATTAMQGFLATRYTTPPAIPADRAGLIAFIRTERQKELCFEGHRWFDLRRYAVNSVAPVATTIEHEYLQIINSSAARPPLGKYTLAPYSAATRGSWMLPIPAEAVDYSYPLIENFSRTAGVTQTIY